MSFKTGVLILGMVTMALSQINEGNDTSFLSVPQTTTKTSLSKSDITKMSLISASDISKTGAVIYGVGAVIEVSGIAVGLIADAIGNYYAFGGETMFMSGSIANLTGNIVACAGGSQARRALRNSGSTAPPYYGWALFWCSFGMNIAANIVPQPGASFSLGLGSLVFSIGSVVSAVRYTKKVNVTQISSNDFNIYPVISMSKEKKAYGLVFNAGF